MVTQKNLGGILLNERLESVLTFFEKTLPSYYNSKEIRNSQVQMAVNIAGILSSNSDYRSILIDAPVGTGKTFAVLVPSIYNVKKEQSKKIISERVIYATASLNLQAQLRNEELSILQKLGCLNSFLIAKGQTHYICPKRLQQISISPMKKRHLEDFCNNALEGERTEFERKYYPLDDKTWSKINLESQSKCKHCDLEWACPTREHRNKFNDMRHQVVVTNHNQLIQSVLNVLDYRAPIIDFNRAGIVIIDEAHEFEDACLSQIAQQVTFNSIIKWAKETMYEYKIKSAVRVLKNSTDRIRRKLDTSSGRHKLGLTEKEALKEIQKILEEYQSRQLAYQAKKLFKNIEDYDEIERVQVVIKNALNEVEYTSWINIDENKNDSIVVVTKKFKSEINKIINELSRKNKLIFTSGTLAVKGSFDHLYHSWKGKPPSSTTSILTTVFNYSEQAIVYLPKHIPDSPGLTSPMFKQYCDAIGDEIYELIKITNGRTLILATSHKQMEMLYNYLQPKLSLLNIKFLKQGQKSVELLSEDFKQDETSVLIGTGSFFTGLSVKGKSLISVILCKLPFPPKDDPFLDLLAGGDDYNDRMEYVDIPRMLIKLLQAGGRLIRSIKDFGCFTILDPRVHDKKKGYATQVIENLKQQKYRITTERDEVKKFIELRMNMKKYPSYPKYKRDKLSIPESLQRDEYQGIVVNLSSSQDKFSVQVPSNGNSVFTPKQLAFYREIRLKLGMNDKLLKTIKDPFGMLKHLYQLAIKKEFPIDVLDTFPYESEEQRQNFQRKIKDNNSPSKVVSYILSPKEIKELEKNWAKPKTGIK